MIQNTYKQAELQCQLCHPNYVDLLGQTGCCYDYSKDWEE